MTNKTVDEIVKVCGIARNQAMEAWHICLEENNKRNKDIENKDKALLISLLESVDNLACEFPDIKDLKGFQHHQWCITIRSLFETVSNYRLNTIHTTKTTRDYHVGESDYSSKSIQPWDIWANWGLNPWDCDIAKRTVRTKVVPGMSAKESRIQDYEKIKHICDERISQINNGDPWYAHIVIPDWVGK